MSIFGALQEFSQAVQVLNPIMQPSVPRTQRRKTLNAVLNELSEDTFNRGAIGKRIVKMNMIDMSEEISKKYVNADAQVDGVISWLPRMKVHRDRLLKEVSKRRKKYGLIV